MLEFADFSRVLETETPKLTLVKPVTEKVAGNGCDNPGSDAQRIMQSARRILQGGVDATGEVAACYDGNGHPDFLSFKRVTLGAAGSGTEVQTTSFSVRSNLFQPTRLYIADSICVNILVRDLKIGSKSILNLDEANAAFLMGEEFSTRAQTCPALGFCPAPTSQTVTITVENISAAAVIFLGGLRGISA